MWNVESLKVAIRFGNLVQLKKCETTFIRVGTSNIEFQQCKKYLGVMLNENLNWKNHITNKCKIASFNLHKIHKVNRNCSIENLKKIGTKCYYIPSWLCYFHAICSS